MECSINAWRSGPGALQFPLPALVLGYKLSGVCNNSPCCRAVCLTTILLHAVDKKGMPDPNANVNNNSTKPICVQSFWNNKRISSSKATSNMVQK
eukprot:6187501-Amphidinium_carterae.1